jgi:hypothetical protein
MHRFGLCAKWQNWTANHAACAARATGTVTDKADITVEILSMMDSRSAEDISYRVVAKHVRNAAALAAFTTNSRSPMPRMGLVAGPDGYERARPPEPGPDEKGWQLAVELMQALVRNWR